MKSTFLGIVALLLLSTFVCADYFDDNDNNDDDRDSTQTSAMSGELKTWSRTMTVWLKDGKVTSPDDQIQVDADAEIVPNDSGKDYWKTSEYINFDFNLPEGATRINVDFKFVSNSNITGEAMLRWNNKKVKKDGKSLLIPFEGTNFSKSLELSSAKTQNSLMLICTKGTIGVERLTITAEIPYPHLDLNGLVLALTSPDPSKSLDGTPVEICWDVIKGDAYGGWVKIEYQIPGQAWQVVPGLEGVTYGTDNWGKFLWNTPPQARSCNFRFQYHRGENPIDKEKAENERKNKAVSEAITKLILSKKDFLDQTKKLISTSFWFRRYNEAREDRNELSAALDTALRKEKMDLEKVVGLVDKLEGIYFQAFAKMMEVALTLEDRKERDDILVNVEKFMELLDDEYYRAVENYGTDEDTKELIPKLFSKERFSAFKKAKEKFENDLKKLDEETSPSLSADIRNLINAKKQFLDETRLTIPSTYWYKNFSDLQSISQNLNAQIEALLRDEKHMDLEKIVQNLNNLDGIYSAVLLKMMDIASTFDNLKERENVLTIVEKYLVNFTGVNESIIARYGNLEDTRELVPVLFPQERFLQIKTEKDKLSLITSAYKKTQRYKNPTTKITALNNLKEHDKVHLHSITFTKNRSTLISYRVYSPFRQTVHISGNLTDLDASSARISEDKDYAFVFLNEDIFYTYENGTYTVHHDSFDSDKLVEKPLLSPDQRFLCKNLGDKLVIEDFQGKVCFPFENLHAKCIQFDTESRLYYEKDKVLYRTTRFTEGSSSQILDLDNILTYSISENGRYLVYITEDFKYIVKNLWNDSTVEINTENVLKNHPEHVAIRNNTIVFTGSGNLFAFSVDGTKLGEFQVEREQIMAISPDGLVVLCNGKLQDIYTGSILTEVMESNPRFIKWDEDGLYLWSDNTAQLVQYIFN